jgi:hypothetical protein
MDPTEGSETSANINQTLGIHPKVETIKNERILTSEGGSSRSHYVESWLWKRLWTGRETD